MVKRGLSIILSFALCIICFSNTYVTAEALDGIQINAGSTTVSVTNMSNINRFASIRIECTDMAMGTYVSSTTNSAVLSYGNTISGSIGAYHTMMYSYHAYVTVYNSANPISGIYLAFDYEMG